MTARCLTQRCLQNLPCRGYRGIWHKGPSIFYLCRSIDQDRIHLSIFSDRSIEKNDRFDRKNRIFRMFLTVFPPFYAKRSNRSHRSSIVYLFLNKIVANWYTYCRSCRGKPIVPLAPFRQQNKLGSSFHSELKYQPRIIPNYSVKFIKFV